VAKRRKTGGRKPGTPNRVTVDVREAMRELAQGLAPRIQGWLTEVADADPGRALDLYLRALEYSVPKMGRLAVDLAALSDQEMLTEVERRAAVARAHDAARGFDVRSMSTSELMAIACGPNQPQI
jgi:hypothetical protein